MPIRVGLVAGSSVVELPPDILTTVPSGQVTVVVQDAQGMPITLDGSLRHFASVGSSRVTTVDLTRSVGFHHLQMAPGIHYWFGTEDDKLRLKGIEALLQLLRNEGVHWSGQILFSDGSYLRDSHVVYGWLDRYADEALEAIASIGRMPRFMRHRIEVVASRPTRPALHGPTLKLLRARPKDLLEPATSGPIKLGGTHYVPRQVVVRSNSQSIDTPANRRAVWLTRVIIELSGQVQDESEKPDVKSRCDGWIKRAREILNRTRLGSLSGVAGKGAHVGRTVHESVDSRYRATYAIAATLHNFLGWTAQRQRRELYSFIHYSDEIYLAFVAHVAAAALGLEPTYKAQPAFRGADWDCYVDYIPPPNVLRSWRSFTQAPDDFRPDLLFVRRDGAVVIADAKYRNDGTHASQSSRRDLMSYMNAFGLARSVVFFPPTPLDDLVGQLALTLTAVLESSAEIPRWH